MIFKNLTEITCLAHIDWKSVSSNDDLYGLQEELNLDASRARYIEIGDILTFPHMSEITELETVLAVRPRAISVKEHLSIRTEACSRIATLLGAAAHADDDDTSVCVYTDRVGVMRLKWDDFIRDGADAEISLWRERFASLGAPPRETL